MKKIGLGIVFFLFVSGSDAVAQASLVFRDASGVHMGALVRPLDSEPSAIELMTDDGYLMVVSSANGFAGLNPVLDAGNAFDTYFTEPNCQGNGYFEATSNWMLYRGGQVIQTVPGGSMYRIPWGAAIEITAQSWAPALEPLCSPSSAVVMAVQPEFVPDSYGATVSQFGSLFQQPFVTSIERPNVISCNGFESCPTTN